jgi:hypothetical protein
MRLTAGSRIYDLTARALVVDGRCDPVFASAAEGAALERALAGGAVLVHLPHPTGDMLRRCAEEGVAVVVPPEAVAGALEAGLAVDRVAADSLLLDVTGAACPMAATAVGVIRGARIVRTDDVRGARRVCDVLAAVLEAR